MLKARVTYLAAAAAFAVSLLSACGGGNSDGTAPQVSTSQSPTLVWDSGDWGTKDWN
jgi:hypothetical protein